jgi:hypothetical protein
MMRVTAAMDEFMATVLRHLRTGQSNPLEELGLEKAADEIGTGGRISQVQERRTKRGRAVTKRTVEVARDIHGMILFGLAGAPTLKAQVARPPVKELYLLLETFVAATSPLGVRIPHPSALTLETRQDLETRRLRTRGLAGPYPGMAR